MARTSASKRPPGLIAKLVDKLFMGASWLLIWPICLFLFSVALDWTLIVLGVWPIDHARTMLDTELRYLGMMDQSLYGIPASSIALGMMDQVERWGLAGLQKDMADSAIMAVQAAEAALSSAINILLILIVRLAIVCCALPAFLLVGLVAFTDGLVERDIRRFCGAVESSWVYHLAKPWVMPSILLATVVYLTIPISVNPGIIFLPAIAAMGISIYIVGWRFKLFA